MQATLSRAAIPFALIERLRRDVCKIGLVLFHNSTSTPLSLTGLVFRFQFIRNGVTILDLADAAILRTAVNRLEITLTTAQKTLLASAGEYEVFLYEETGQVTFLEGLFRWVKPRPGTAVGLKNPPDIGIVYDTETSIVLRTVLVIQGQAGSIWYNSFSAPVAGSGFDTDYHLNRTTGDLYYRTAGAWGLIGNVKGPAGTLTSSALSQTEGWDTDLLVAQTAAGALIKTFSLRMLGLAPSSSLEQPFSPTRLNLALGYEGVGMQMGGKLSNLMAFGIVRGLFPAPTTAVTGTASVTSVTALTDDGDNVDAVLAGGATGGTVQITYAFTNPLPVFSQAVFRFFHVERYPYTPADLSNVKVEWQTSASGTPFRTIYNGGYATNKGFFETPATTEPDFPIRGLRVTYTIPATKTVRLMELGIAHMKLAFGRGTLAELHQPNLFSKANTFSGGNTFSGPNTFSGNNTFSGETTLKRIISSGLAPSAAVGTGAGSGGTVSIGAGSTDMAGTITLNIGSSPPTVQTVATITFASAMAAAPRAIVISARNNQAGMSLARFFIATKTASAWTISSTDVALSASTTYMLDYIIIA